MVNASAPGRCRLEGPDPFSSRQHQRLRSTGCSWAWLCRHRGQAPERSGDRPAPARRYGCAGTRIPWAYCIRWAAPLRSRRTAGDHQPPHADHADSSRGGFGAGPVAWRLSRERCRTGVGRAENLRQPTSAPTAL